MRPRARFDKRGMLAIKADFWGVLFDAPEEASGYELKDGVAIVSIQGPLTNHDEWFWDSYDAIQERVGGALASEAKAVVLKIDSPGGDATGVFEASRAIRSMAKTAGKPLFAYVDGMAASAAYALACSADHITCPSSSYVGSIGAVSMLVDETALDRAIGLNFAVIASGARKTDGNPHVPISDEARAEVKARVDEIARVFAELVAETRPISAEQALGLEAALFSGARAQKLGLADAVGSLATVLTLAKGGTPATATPEEKPAMSMNKEEMRKTLQGIADGDDEEAAEAAKKCLKALDEDGDNDKDKEPKESKAEEAPPEKKDEEKKKEDEAKAKAAEATVKVLVEKHLQAGETARRERELLDKEVAERVEDASMREWCASQTSAVVRSFLDKLPKKMAARNAKPLQGANDQGSPGLSGPELEEYNRAKGLRTDAVSGPTRREDGTFVVPTMTPSEFRKNEAKARSEGKA